MTSNEIRELIDDEGDEYKELMLGEIAFQLAKLNEHFEMVDQSVFGGVDAKKKS